MEEVETTKDVVEKEIIEEDKKETTKKRVHEMVKQMSMSAEGSGMLKSGSESSLSEAENTKEAARSHEEKEECSDNESSNGSGNKSSPQNSNQSAAVVLRRKSRGNPMFRKSEGGGRADSDGTPAK